MNCYLQQLTKQYSQYRIILLLDRAGWHISHSIHLPENLLLLPLPAYSPELNPVELLWREIRRKYFHNKISNSLDDVEDTLSIALSAYHKNASGIKQLSRGYNYFNNIGSG